MIKFPGSSYRYQLQKADRQRTMIFQVALPFSVHVVCTVANDELSLLQSIEGDGCNPNKSRLNRNCAMLGLSCSGLSNHRKRNMFRSTGLILTIRKAFSMSAVRPTKLLRNLANMSNMCGM